MELRISGNDKEALKKIEELAKDLGLRISRKMNLETQTEMNNDALIRLMKEMAASGGITSIEDPIEWQRELRRDRFLPGRE